VFRKFSIFLIFASLYAYSYLLSKNIFEFYLAYLIFIAYFPFFLVKFGLPRWPVLVFIPLLLSGLLYCAIDLNTTQQFFKTFIGFFAACLFYHYVVQSYDFDIKELYRLYMQSAFIVSALGLFQLTSYLVGFTPGYNWKWILNKWGPTYGGLGIRMNSVLSEPAYFAAVISPAFFTSLYNSTKRNPLFISKFQSLFIVGVFPLTFSSLGILAIFISIILLLINLGFFRYFFIFLPIFIVASTYAYNNVEEFRERYDSTLELYNTENIYDYTIHGSSFVLYNNTHVAWENFKSHPIFGTGLGSHPTAFDKYSLTNIEGAVQIDFNKMDANSMFLRLMSETGLYGLSVMMMLLFRCWIFKGNAMDDAAWVISNSLTIIIIIYLVRQGHYFINGFPLFLWLYYYLYVQNKETMANRKAETRAADRALFREPTGASQLSQEHI
jgi:hypothetical protein